MKKQFTLGLVAAAFFAHAAGAAEPLQTPAPEGAGTVPAGKPVAWKYRALLSGLDLFERRSAELAPGATLRFKLPKGISLAPDTTVEIALAQDPIKLQTAPDNSFTLTRETRTGAGKADVVVRGRHFAPEEYRHPNIEVSTPGLPAHVRRLGDLRLACEVQVEIAKADLLAARAILGTFGLFGLNICKSDSNIGMDAPGQYDAITLSADGREMKLSKLSGRFNAPLGDAAWPDATLLQFTLGGQPAQPSLQP
ncbi:hypothetical protein [Massilia glaciei]|uniref:Uncharacterized protein n=1 Tax=Massilia glaciei TaxID=1524097 RepID=A0A2U2HLF3_9BURK|nr:hypothetical protein [Massilia glaciei]PWF48262.1 hypothetical protein C7C56_012630 [Massilia glaciei]